MINPKVSICIPAYKQPLLIRRLLDSILIQDYKDFEVIITDDSPDNEIQEVCNEYKSFFNLKYFKNAIRKGSPGNWNESIRLSSGEYIKIMHHDDWFNYKNSLRDFINPLLENNKLNFAFSSSLILLENGQKKIHKVSSSEIDLINKNPKIIFSSNKIGAPSAVIFKRSNSFFFDENLKWLVDVDFYLSIIKTNTFVYIDKDLITTYGAKGRITDTCVNNAQIEVFENFYILDKLMNKTYGPPKKISHKSLVKIISICNKYNVNNVNDIREYFFTGKVHYKIRIYFFINKLFIHLLKLLISLNFKFKLLCIRRIINFIKNRIDKVRYNLVGHKIDKTSSVINSELGKNVSIGRSCYVSNIKLGDYSYLSKNVTIMNSVVGKFCSIAQGVIVSAGMHPTNTFVSTSPVFFSTYSQCGKTFSDKNYFEEMGNVIIGNDVWIGANSVLMDNIVIGDGVIIGAGSIVTKNVPPYAIVVGAPAKIIKFRFSEEEISFLNNYKWWDREEEWIRANYKDFHNINEFILKYRK